MLKPKKQHTKET